MTAQSSPIANPSVMCTSWRPSPPPFVHIHVDASFMNIKTKASMAEVIRDSLGGWLLGFFFHFPMLLTHIMQNSWL